MISRNAKTSSITALSRAIALSAALLAGAAVTAPVAFAQDAVTMYADKNIIENAVNSKDHTTLVAAVKAAGLVDTLSGAGPFTVFAPTNEAFAKLPAGTVENLLKPENKDQLVAVLTYHVIPGKVMAADIAGKEMETATVQGSTVDINATGDAVMVDGAKVVTADIAASNGVIHVIDAVILPE